MLYLLDTNAVSALMREEARTLSWLANLNPEDQVIVCTIVRGEILFGLEKLATGRRRTELEVRAAALFSAIPCLPVPASAAEFYATTKLARQRVGRTLDENDLWIASTALALGAILVSNDSDFLSLGLLSVVNP